MGSETLRFIVKAKDEASKTLRGVGGAFSSIGKLAKVGMAVAAAGIGLVIVAVTSLIGFLFKAKAAYEDWMGTVVHMTWITGLASKAASKLSGEFQLSGVDAKSGQTGVFMFTKALDKARQGTSKTATGFQRLHIALKDGTGHWRSTGKLIDVARDKLSRIKDAATRAGIAALLFGRGAKTLVPWLVRSAKTMKEYDSWLKQAGLSMGGQAVKQFKQYREDQKHMSVLWQGFKVNAFRALVPLIGKIMPTLIGLMKGAAKWMKRFADVATHKGILKALEKTVPGFKKLEDGARKVAHFVVSNWPKIRHAFATVGSAIGKVIDWIHRNHTAFSVLKTIAMAVLKEIAREIKLAWTIGGKFVTVVTAIASAVKTVSTTAFDAVKRVLQDIIGAAQTAWSWIQKVIGGASTARSVSGNMGRNAGSAPRHYAAGGSFFTHGEQAIVVGDNPGGVERVDVTPVSSRGRGAPSTTIVNHYHFPNRMAMAGSAQQFADALGPYQEKTAQRQAASAGRHR